MSRNGPRVHEGKHHTLPYFPPTFAHNMESIERATVTVPQELRFWQRVPKGESAGLHIHFHGYAERGEEVCTLLAAHLPPDIHLLCPEGQARFYKRGLGGSVGSSWMTKDDRLLDIANIQRYIDAVLGGAGGTEKIKVSAFSQGVPVAIRWLAQYRLKPQALYLAAARLPEQPYLDTLATLMDGVHFVTPKADELISAEDYEKEAARLIEAGISTQRILPHTPHIFDAALMARELYGV